VLRRRYEHQRSDGEQPQAEAQRWASDRNERRRRHGMRRVPCQLREHARPRALPQLLGRSLGATLPACEREQAGVLQ
jgi:hypothetical protein